MQTKVTATSPSSAPSFGSSSPEINYLRVRNTSVIPLCLLIAPMDPTPIPNPDAELICIGTPFSPPSPPPI
ncbi:hypothetical protein ABVK25_001756 [Lepraria finkii]|uniref:Uncharacterized protein n=1 Tax=Lepraria finkii TaxID=1340010 RepID=A0ABR4BJZ7_9LECA